MDTSYAGVDWASQSHEVCVLTPGRRRGESHSFAHSHAGLVAMTAWLATKVAEPSQLAIAIEVPHGPVVEALLEGGFRVYSINPKQLDRFRDRHTVAGAKDDRLDAFVLADSLRTDGPLFSELAPPDSAAIELRALSRLYERLGGDLNRETNRLWQELIRSRPELLRLCPGANEPWLWDVLKLMLKDRPVRLVQVAAVLARHRKKAVTAPQVLGLLKLPALTLSPGSLAAARLAMGILLPLVELLHSQREACRAQLTEAVRGQGRLAEIVDSLPGVDIVLAAVLLAEAGDALAEANLPALRSLSGAAPVTRRSGRSHTVSMRRGCDPRLRNGLRNVARTAARCDPWAHAYYQAMRARGLDHERALRGLGDRLLGRLAAMIRLDELYDPLRYLKVPLAA